jgi:hypothetical protein
MFPEYYYEFTQNNSVTNNAKDKMSYDVHDSTIQYINPGKDEEHDDVIFVGEALLVRQSELSGVNLGNYSFCIRSTQSNFDIFNQELKQFQIYLILRSDELLIKGVQSINSGQQADGFHSINAGYSLLKTASIVASSENMAIRNRFSTIKPILDSSFPAYIQTKLNSLNAELESSKKFDRRNYLDKISETYKKVSDLKSIAVNFGFKDKNLDNQYSRVSADEASVLNFLRYGKSFPSTKSFKSSPVSAF